MTRESLSADDDRPVDAQQLYIESKSAERLLRRLALRSRYEHLYETYCRHSPDR